jgi:hypothetical protein
MMTTETQQGTPKAGLNWHNPSWVLLLVALPWASLTEFDELTLRAFGLIPLPLIGTGSQRYTSTNDAKTCALPDISRSGLEQRLGWLLLRNPI